jgi:iron(III) transport system ATP-binding protein
VSERNDLNVANVSKQFEVITALQGAAFASPPGSFTAFLGPSGCGKTTLLRIIAGFETPTTGTVSIGGEVVAGDGRWIEPEHRRVGIVPQEAALFPHLSIQDNVGFGLARGERRGSKVSALLELVGLADTARRRPHELSGGQQQRVALARCLATRPRVVLLDEPFSALDASLRIEIRNETRALLREAGTTTVLVTHDQDEALSLADHVALMHAGRIVQFATPGELYSSPCSTWAASFVGDANLLPILGSSPSGDVVDTPVGRLMVRGDFRCAGDAGFALLRPEQCELAGADGVAAIVTDVVFHGHDHLITVQVPPLPNQAESLRLTVRAPSHVHPVVGTAVHVAVTGPALLLSDSV